MKRIGIKLFLILVLIFGMFILILYVNRFSFRNDESKLGWFTNKCFNLNEFEFNNSPDDILVVWSSNRIEKIIFEKGRFVSNIPNEYGVNSFQIYRGDEHLKSFAFMKPNWWNTYKFTFEFRQDSVSLSMNPTLNNLTSFDDR